MYDSFVFHPGCWLSQAMDEAYGLTKTGNSEVRFCWHKLCLRGKALFIVPHVLDFVTSMVRNGSDSEEVLLWEGALRNASSTVCAGKRSVKS